LANYQRLQPETKNKDCYQNGKQAYNLLSKISNRKLA
jgi:hypothetical protein